MNGQEETFDVYVIPPNFIDTGTVMGGMFKFRNAAEAVFILGCVGIPVFRLPLDLTQKIIVLCLTALPLTLLALIGVSDESLSSFIWNFFRYRARRRVIYRSDQTDDIERLKNRRPVRDFFHQHFSLPQKEKKEHKKKRKRVKSKPAVHKRPPRRTIPPKKEMSKGVPIPQKSWPRATAQFPQPQAVKKQTGTAGKLPPHRKG